MMMLADLGAEVSKGESLEGDHGRQFVGGSGINAELGGGANAYKPAFALSGEARAASLW